MTDVYEAGSDHAVVLIAGYPDAGFTRVAGCSFKDLPSNVALAQALAAAGVNAVLYANEDPVADARAIVRQVRDIIAPRVSLFACSGNAPVALSLLLRDAEVRIESAAMAYPYTLDVDDAAARWKFANPCSGKTIGDVRDDVPLLIVRAGKDQMPRLNETLDRFVAATLAQNFPVTVVNHPDAQHGFDVAQDANILRFFDTR